MDCKLAIVGARLIDGLSPAPVPSSVVLVGTDGRISAVGPTPEMTVPAGVPRLQATGLTLLPGLIDGHVHLTWDKTLYFAYSSQDYTTRLNLRDPERQLVRAGHYAQMALAAGVTTLRDCGADDFTVLALRDAIDAGDLVGPRVLASGRPITTTGGHIYSDWGTDSAEDVRQAVRLLAGKGVDFVKLILSGGTTTPGTDITRSQYTPEELRAAVEEAHRLGLPIAAHAISTDSIRLAAEAGVDTIEHCSWIGRDPRTTVTDRAAVEQMVRRGVRVDHAIIPRPYLFPDEGPGELSAEERWWLNMLEVRWPFLHDMRAQGVLVFLGTDAAFGPWPGTDRWPGFQEMARAIEILVRWAKFTPMDALALATRDAARSLGLDRDIGTVEPGKRADLILLAGDPLAEPSALRQVEMVFRHGRLVAQRGNIVLEEARAMRERLCA
ncbi:MAG TPA: amidohydrolase family protein [Candidatus Methylomirabilis sp.]|nr:amidohydrolase family protein [Candidatus Methylomirabilis sp.]HSC71164.1 amidohydrolase family protein [Candidatus Methylomirabilis sp.]